MNNSCPHNLKVIYSANPISFLDKPSKSEFAALHFETRNSNIDELIKHISEGRSFTCSTFKSQIRSTNEFKAQQLFALDFDNTMSLEEAEALLTDFNFNYFFGYYTLSHAPVKPRFRLIFMLDGYVEDVNLARDITKALYEIFNRKPDLNALDIPRVWLGTNQEIFYGDFNNLLTPRKIIEIANQIIYANDRNQVRNLLPLEQIIEDNCAKTDKPITYKYNNIQKCTKSIDEVNEEIKKKIINNFSIDELLVCEIFRVFYQGLGTETKVNKLVHYELVGIASNLLSIKGGNKLFKQCLDKNGKYSREKYGIFSYLKRNNYNPSKFKSFSPFDEDAENPFQTFPELLLKKGKIKIINPKLMPKLKTLNEAEISLRQSYDKIIASKDNKVYLVKAAAGLGKTELFKNTKGLVLAFPDNKLKDEQFNSSKLEDKLITPSSIGLFSEELSRHIEYLYSTGRNERVLTLINDVINYKISKLGRLNITNKDKLAAVEYLDKINKAKNSTLETSIFTTHTRAIFTQYPHRTLVFDEDPLKQLFYINKVSISELTLISESYSVQKELNEILNVGEQNIYKKTPKFANLEKLKNDVSITLKLETNLLKFLESDYYCNDGSYVHYAINHIIRLPTDKKIVITDATAPEFLWKLLVGKRLEVIDISDVKYIGKINQHTKYSCSRVGLEKYGETISSRVGAEQCITFKGYKPIFSNPVQDMHFGRVRGSNDLCGVDFTVVGTPHLNNHFYLFLAKACKLEITDYEMKYREVEYRNKEFWFHTFLDENLMKIHLELVEAEIIQAVSRARLIRFDAVVELYSSFPIDQAIYHFH